MALMQLVDGPAAAKTEESKPAEAESGGRKRTRKAPAGEAKKPRAARKKAAAAA